MLEVLFEIVGEILLQVVAELHIEIGLRSMAEPFHKPPNPWIAAFGYALFGTALGAMSLLMLPVLLVNGQTWRLVNLAVTPLVAGLAMAALGIWRTQRGQSILRLDRFSYGYLFALSMAIVRFYFAS